MRVTQGKTLDNNEEWFAAKHAVDKFLPTFAVTETADGAGWLKLEFEKSYTIEFVVVYHRFYNNWYHQSWCLQSEERFKACVNSENNVDVSVYQGDVKQKSCGTLQLTYGLEQSDQIYTLFCNTEGDTVKLSKSSGKILVAEIAVTTTIGEMFYFSQLLTLFFSSTPNLTVESPPR